ALHKFNAESCTCGCKFTLAQCRIYDPGCQTSQKRTAQIVKELAKPETKQPSKETDTAPALPPAATELPRP
ncbi:MAG TPA: hypothetical protein VK728_01825, partial [Candidatus Sulfotelmatobacter sp.]|nr:hypothetical protein [Candidatus Sulfotelmatobacter sp.]